MATVSFSLPDTLKAWVEDQAQGRHFGTVGDYMRDLIRREQQRDEAVQEIQSLIDASLASGPSRDFDMGAFIARQKAR